MNLNKITLNETVYDVHRVYSGESTVAEIIKKRLMSANVHISPLTGVKSVVYNNCEVDMPREVK